ncbi:MAG: hypothetical protein ACPLRM_03625 [Anaerolineae bacterium]
MGIDQPPEDRLRRYVTYEDCSSWIEEFEHVHSCTIRINLLIKRKPSTGQRVMAVIVSVWRRGPRDERLFIAQQDVPFGKQTDHATLPSALIYALVLLDRYFMEHEGRSLDQKGSGDDALRVDF